MSLQDILEKIKPFYTLMLIVVIASVLAGIWQFIAISNRHLPIKIEYRDDTQLGNAIGAITANSKTVSTNEAGVVGSKSGKKYYFPWCGALKRVKLENRVNFSSIDAAKQAGYTAAANCKGLQ